MALLLTMSHRDNNPVSDKLVIIRSSLPGDSGCWLSSPQRQLCFNMTGSHARPVFLIPDVGDIEVDSDTSGLDLVLEIGFGLHLVIFSVEE